MNTNQNNRLTIAAIQMDANPAPTDERIERAEKLVVGATESGAQIVVLPECFNTGYTFSDENHSRVERINGPTGTWLRETAARLNIHLTGSFMMLDGGETYNTLLMFAPHGRSWRYDKCYPWGWERGYFRPSRQDPRITIADTELGDIGILICWDVSHVELWQKYAGSVDMMIISSCPVDVGHAIFQLPGNNQFSLGDLGSRFAANTKTVTLAFGDMIDQQTAWLGVPTVHSTGCGHIQTDIPQGRQGLLGFVLAAPGMIKYFPQANDLQMSCDLVQECKILDNEGQALSRLSAEDGDSFTIAEVDLPPEKSTPHQPQPPSLIPGISYLLADTYLPIVTRTVYNRGRRQWRKFHQ